MPIQIIKPSLYRPTYLAQTGFVANVAASTTAFADLFNATGSGKIMRIIGLYIIPSQVAVTGVGLTWNFTREITVGTGGSNVTIQKFDPNDADAPAQITCRSKPTGGASGGTNILDTTSSSEETTPYACMAMTLNHIPQCREDTTNEGIVVRENSGVTVLQTTSSAVGTTAIRFVFTLE